jgi:Prion-inhibition and propagation
MKQTKRQSRGTNNRRPPIAAKKKRRTVLPVMLLWSRRDQSRFIQAVERLSSLVNDLERVLAPAKRRRRLSDPPAVSNNGHPESS